MNLEDDMLIDDYFRKNLSDDEVSKFKLRLNSDKAFKENYELEKALRVSQNDDDWNYISTPTKAHEDYKTILDSEDFKKIKETISQVDSDFELPKNKKPIRFGYYIAAASIVLFLGFQFFFNTATSSLKLYENYLNLNDLPTFASRGNDNNKLVNAEHYFKNKEYTKALEIFNDQQSNVENTSSVLIYKGISETELEKYAEAEKTLDRLIESDLLDAEKGYWYKALLYLKQENFEETKRILNSIVSKSYYNFKEAEELLVEMK